MHGQKDGGNAHINKCAFYAGGKKHIIYVGKSTHIMHGQTPRWECPHFFRHILCVGKNAHNIRGENNAYYAWAKTLWECPLFFTRILCVGRNAHNIRGKKRRILCMGKPHRGNAHIFSDTFYAWEKMRII